jgi:hypothetical protein
MTVDRQITEESKRIAREQEREQAIADQAVIEAKDPRNWREGFGYAVDEDCNPMANEIVVQMMAGDPQLAGLLVANYILYAYIPEVAERIITERENNNEWHERNQEKERRAKNWRAMPENERG